MTIATTSNRIICQGNGVTTIFSYNFIIPQASQARVIYTDANGIETELTTTQYTITGLDEPLGGTVTYPLSGSPIATGTTLTIIRQLTLTQETTIGNQGAFYPQAVDAALDYEMMVSQQLQEEIGRNLTVAETDETPGLLPTAAARANQILGFDAAGDPIAAQPSSALVSSAMQGFVSAASLGAARTILGVDFPAAWGGVAGGSANALTITAAGYAVTDGAMLAFRAGAANSAATTINVNGAGNSLLAKQVSGGRPGLTGGELITGNLYLAVWYAADGKYVLLNPSEAPPYLFLGGLDLSNNSGAPNTVVDMAAGTAADAGNVVMMRNAATKNINCAVVGANGLDAGALANSTWYAVYAIMSGTGVVAGIASTNFTTPTLPSGYAWFRRRGAFLTDGSAHIIPFRNKGKNFWWMTPVVDLLAGPATASTTAVLTALTVPSGINPLANISAKFFSADGPVATLISSPNLTDVACTDINANLNAFTNGQGAANLQIETNTSRQIRRRNNTAQTNCFAYITTYGWQDPLT